MTALEGHDKHHPLALKLARAFTQAAGKTSLTDSSIPLTLGTAWSIAPGYVLTNNHVTALADSAFLVGKSQQRIPARVILRDETHDIALLRVESHNQMPPPLPLAKIGTPLGASVFTVGFPRADILGQSPKLAQGIISGENGLLDDPYTYQISVPIQPGNSGGPLLDMEGKVVGVVTSMLSIESGPGKPAYPPPPSLLCPKNSNRQRPFGVATPGPTPRKPHSL